VGQSKAFQFMVRAGNLITNNLSNAYAADAVALRGETSLYVYARACVRAIFGETHDKISKNDNNLRVVDTITARAVCVRCIVHVSRLIGDCLLHQIAEILLVESIYVSIFTH